MLFQKLCHNKGRNTARIMLETLQTFNPNDKRKDKCAAIDKNPREILIDKLTVGLQPDRSTKAKYQQKLQSKSE